MRIPQNPPSNEELTRILSAPSSKGMIDKLGGYIERVNSEYLHWDELSMRFKELDSDELKLLWSYVYLIRKSSARPILINGLKLIYFQTPQIEKTLHNLDMQIGDKIEIDSQISSPNLKKKYLVNSLMEEAIASSQLEGAATTRAVAKKMLQENRKPKNPSEQMIVNNYFTMGYIKEHTKPNDLLTLDLIKEIHKRVTKDTFEDKSYEGAFRTDNEVKVVSRDENQTIYVPPDYTQVQNLLESVCKFINGEPSEYYLHPMVKAIILHYMLGYIHPFNDGNGRTARALFYWYLISQHYDYLEYIAVSTAIKNATTKYPLAYLYSENDNNDVTYFVKFNLRALGIAVESFKNYLETKKTENRKIMQTIRHNPKLNFRQADIIISMSKDERQLTIAEMQERYDITYQTARSDLLALVKLGYMHKHLLAKQFIFVLDKEKCMSAIEPKHQ